MEKITGKVEKYNQSGDKAPGIFVNGKWYNATTITQKYVEELKNKIGSTIEINVNEPNKITYLKVLEEASEQPKSEKKFESKTETKSNDYGHGARIGMAMNIAATRVNSVVDKMEKQPPSNEWAVAVCEIAKLLLDEMDRHGLQ